MHAYRQVLKYVLNKGLLTAPTRTGSRTLATRALQMRYDFSKKPSWFKKIWAQVTATELADNVTTFNFPLLTSRKMNHKAIFAELDGFLKGITDKKWYQDNGCPFWNEWGNQRIVREKMDLIGDHSDETRKKLQKNERDMYSGYGWDWRHFGATYHGYELNYDGKGIDQLKNVVTNLKKNPLDRQQVMSAWNPVNKEEYALPPCIYAYQFSSLDGTTLDLTYDQRSCDLCLGGPNDFASNALLLILVARAIGMKPGVVTAQLKIPHIYDLHIEKAKKLVKRRPGRMPLLELAENVDCFNFNYADAKIKNYKHKKSLSFERSV